jgi:putative hemolysin
MDVIIYAIVIVFCLLLSAFFSGSETALLRVSSHDVDEDIKEHVRPTIAAVKELIRNTSRLLVTILLGNNIVNILATSTASALCIYYFGNEQGVIISTIAMTVLVLIFSEIIPKAVAAKNPKRISYIVSLPLYFLHLLLSPVHWFFEKLIDPIVSTLTGSTSTENVRAYDSILAMARQVKEDNGASNIHAEGSPLPIIGSTARAAEMTAEEIMIPRAEVFASPHDIKPEELLARMMKERYTRVPIFEETLDTVLGVIHLKDLVRIIHAQKNKTISSIIKPILRVPERKAIFTILAEMQRGFTHMAIVKDEFGTTQGLITQEDILEEIVGEIRDEFDKEELQSIQKITDHSYIVLGRTPVHDFNRQTGWEIPMEEKGDTFSGLVFNTLGHTPNLGDKIKIDEYEISVSDVSGNRITYVHVLKGAMEDEEEI